MAIVRWRPFETAWDREMLAMMDRFFGRDWFAGEDLGWKPRVDMFRRNGNLIVRAELPGIDPAKDLDIEVEGDLLHIRGERKFDEEVTDEDRYVKERFYGSYDRRLVLPEGVDPDKLEATYEAGVLTITVPLPVEVQPTARKIEVTKS